MKYAVKCTFGKGKALSCAASTVWDSAQFTICNICTCQLTKRRKSSRDFSPGVCFVGGWMKLITTLSWFWMYHLKEQPQESQKYYYGNLLKLHTLLWKLPHTLATHQFNYKKASQQWLHIKVRAIQSIYTSPNADCKMRIKTAERAVTNWFPS